MKQDTFAGFHPAVNLCFFLAAMMITMFFSHPVLLLISLVSSCAYLLYLQGRKGMLRQVGYLLPVKPPARKAASLLWPLPAMMAMAVSPSWIP